MLTSATRGERLTPNPNECNSTLASGTNNIYPYPYIDINDRVTASDRGHRLRITHMLRTGCEPATFRVSTLRLNRSATVRALSHLPFPDSINAIFSPTLKFNFLC